MQKLLDQFLDLIPTSYAAYRGVVADALSFYWQALPEHRRAAMLERQRALGRESTAAERLFAFFIESPILHKFGQVLGRDTRLDRSLRSVLQRLEVLPSRRGAEEVRSIVQPVESQCVDHGVSISYTILAEASVAVVVPVTWMNGEGRFPRGVLKILKPNVADRIAEEFAIWKALSGVVTDSCAAAGLPAVDFAEVFERALALIEGDLDFSREYQNLTLAGRIYAPYTGVNVPAVSDICLPEALLMERLVGRHVGDAATIESCADIVSPMMTARRMVKSLLATPILYEGERTIIHGDPHGGNILLDGRGRLGLIDWSMAAVLDRADRAAAVRLFFSALLHDVAAVTADLAFMCARREGHEGVNELALQRAVEKHLCRHKADMSAPIHWLMTFMDAIVQEGVVFRSRWLVLRKAYLTCRGLLEEICPTFRSDWFLGTILGEELTREWPARCMGGPWWRSPRTHLSNIELANFSARLPWMAYSAAFT